MNCKEVIGNIKDYQIDNKTIDTLNLEWFETNKRIMRKKTESNQEIVIQFLREGIRLAEGDILFEDAEKVVVVNILPCDAIKVTPKSLYEMATICYEIGNKHLPLFIKDDSLLIPYEKPLELLLTNGGYEVSKVSDKLQHMLKATSEPHQHHHAHSHDGKEYSHAHHLSHS